MPGECAMSRRIILASRGGGKRKIFPRVIIAVLLATVAIASSPAGSVEVGEVPPDYLGKSKDGVEVYLSDSAGRIRIVSFWATWCSPCMKELPALSAIQRHGGADRIYVIAVNLEEPRKQYRKALRAFKEYALEFVHDRRGAIAKRYDVVGIPHLLIVDVDGTVAFKHVGYGEGALEGILSDINSLLIKNSVKSGD